KPLRIAYEPHELDGRPERGNARAAGWAVARRRSVAASAESVTSQGRRPPAGYGRKCERARGLIRLPSPVLDLGPLPARVRRRRERVQGWQFATLTSIAQVRPAGDPDCHPAGG